MPQPDTHPHAALDLRAVTVEEHAAQCKGTRGIGLERIVGWYHTDLCSTCGAVICTFEQPASTGSEHGE